MAYFQIFVLLDLNGTHLSDPFQHHMLMGICFGRSHESGMYARLASMGLSNHYFNAIDILSPREWVDVILKGYGYATDCDMSLLFSRLYDNLCFPNASRLVGSTTWTSLRSASWRQRTTWDVGGGGTWIPSFTVTESEMPPSRRGYIEHRGSKDHFESLDWHYLAGKQFIHDAAKGGNPNPPKITSPGPVVVTIIFYSPVDYYMNIYELWKISSSVSLFSIPSSRSVQIWGWNENKMTSHIFRSEFHADMML
jgi:hypothetical protein